MDTLATAAVIIGAIVFIVFVIMKLGQFWDRNEDTIMMGCLNVFQIIIILGIIGAIILGVKIGGTLGVIIVVVAGLFGVYLIGSELERQQRDKKNKK